MTKKLLVLTGGGDCPGLNAVIRAIYKRAETEGGWEVLGSVEAYNGLLAETPEIMQLDRSNTSGIHVLGGTILGTTNKGEPLKWPVEQPDGSIKFVDRSQEVIDRLKELEIDAVISIGGDGSQAIAHHLSELGVPIIGVPKTIDNDLSSTDYTFGFQTAVQIATDSFDKLVTTATSHSRIMIMEVMGRSAGWIALHAAIAGGAEVCLIPEIPYDIEIVAERIKKRYTGTRGFANIVVAEGAKPKEGAASTRANAETGYHNVRLGGIAYQLAGELQDAGIEASIRETVLGHVQRGGSPIAFDRVLASQFGVMAFEQVLQANFGTMVAAQNNKIVTVPLKEAIAEYNFVDPDSFLVHTARGMGISFGD